MLARIRQIATGSRRVSWDSVVVSARVWGLPWWLSGEESAGSAGDSGGLGLIPGLGRCPGAGSGNSRGVVMEPIQGKLASSQFDSGYTEQFCIPEVTSVLFSSCDSVVGNFLEFNQANRGSLCVWLGKRNCSACNAGESGLISWRGGSLIHTLYENVSEAFHLSLIMYEEGLSKPWSEGSENWFWLGLSLRHLDWIGEYLAKLEFPLYLWF